MIYAIVTETLRRAEWEFHDFLLKFKDEVTKASHTGGVFILVFKDGDEYHFMSKSVYFRWCMGREYMIGDELYRSGTKIFKGEQEWE